MQTCACRITDRTGRGHQPHAARRLTTSPAPQSVPSQASAVQAWGCGTKCRVRLEDQLRVSCCSHAGWNSWCMESSWEWTLDRGLWPEGNGGGGGDAEGGRLEESGARSPIPVSSWLPGRPAEAHPEPMFSSQQHHVPSPPHTGQRPLPAKDTVWMPASSGPRKKVVVLHFSSSEMLL